MDPEHISSAELPNVEFMESLCDTLAGYGVDKDEVRGLGPGVLNFIRYLMNDIEELEQELIALREKTASQAADLKRIRAQRIALLLKVEKLTGQSASSAADLSSTSLRVIEYAEQHNSGTETIRRKASQDD